MKHFLHILSIVCMLLINQAEAQTSYSKTFTATNGSAPPLSITFTVIPQNVNITSSWSKHIQYNINYLLKIEITNAPSGTQIRNLQVAFTNSSTASDVRGYPSDLTTPLSSNPYSVTATTTTTATLTGWDLSQLQDQNLNNNTSVLPLANYQMVDIQFTVANYTSNGPGVYTFNNNYAPGTDMPLTKDTQVLPITLSSFSASLDNGSVLLNWATSTEINNNYFVVERSNDSKTFDSIGIVKGAGNSSSLLNYSFRDYNALNGTNYYRLVQVDYDGKSTVSNVANINVFKTNTTNTFNIYPNPGNGNITIGGNWSNLKNVVVYNLAGALVFSQNISSNKVQLSSSLPSGMYIVNLLDQNGKQHSNKYLLTK